MTDTKELFDEIEDKKLEEKKRLSLRRKEKKLLKNI